MLLISKGAPPATLTEYKKRPQASYDDCPQYVKDDIRSQLLKEQGYLCAYCMCRLSSDPKSMKIEHWTPRNGPFGNRSLELDYKNMLACCLGYEGENPSTCDTKKGDKPLTLDPRNKVHIDKIKYESKTGRIYSDDQTLDNDINYVLNLNCKEHCMMENRRVLLEEFKNFMMDKFSAQSWTKANLLKVLNKYQGIDKNGEKIPYCGIVIWYINSKLKSVPH